MIKKVQRHIFSIILVLSISFLIPMTVYAHEHTSECYTADPHTHEGSEASGGPCYQNAVYHTHIDSCYGVKCGYDDMTKTNEVITTCPNPDCPFLEAINAGYAPAECVTITTYTCSVCGVTGTHTYCNGCGATEDFNEHKSSLVCTLSDSSIDHFTFSCSITGNGQSLICDKKIINATAKNTTQVGTLDKTLVVTYMDGHTGEVQAETTSFDANKKYNSETVLLSYQGFTIGIIYSTDGKVNANGESNIEDVNNGTTTLGSMNDEEENSNGEISNGSMPSNGGGFSSDKEFSITTPIPTPDETTNSNDDGTTNSNTNNDANGLTGYVPTTDSDISTNNNRNGGGTVAVVIIVGILVCGFGGFGFYKYKTRK